MSGLQLPVAFAAAALLAPSAFAPAQSAPVPAQRKVAAAGPPVLLHATVVGPAAWRKRLGPTTVGSMCSSQEAEAIWRGYAERVGAMLAAGGAAGRGGGRGAAGEARAGGEGGAAGGAREPARAPRPFDYAGAVHVVVWLEQAEDALHLPRWSAALIALDDGKTDLAATALECRGLFGDLPERLETAWRDFTLVPPRVENGRLVAVLASPEDVEAATARAIAFACEPLSAPAVLRLDLEVPAALGLLRDHPWQRGLFAALLGPATKRASLQLGSVGPHIALDLTVRFAVGDRGILQGLYPVRAGAPDLEWLVPREASTHYAWRVDLPALWNGWLQVVAALEERDVAFVTERAKKAQGCDLGRDVLAHLGDEAVIVWSHAGDDPAAAATANACLAVPVRDEGAFVDALSAMLEQAGFGGMRADGRFDATLPWFSLSVAHGVACATFVDGDDPLAEAVLEHAWRGRRAREGRVRGAHAAPPGFHGSGRVDMQTLIVRDLYGQLRWLQLVLGSLGRVQILPDVLEVEREARRWLPLLHRHDLVQGTTLGGSTDEQWQLRVLW